jgi:hypothetical protein
MPFGSGCTGRIHVRADSSVRWGKEPGQSTTAKNDPLPNVTLDTNRLIDVDERTLKALQRLSDIVFGGQVKRWGSVPFTALALACWPLMGLANEASTCPTEDGFPQVYQALYADLVGWIALHTVYDVARTWYEPPEIVFCAVGEVIDYEGRDLLVDPALRAAFDLPARRILIVLPWSPDGLIDRSILLHELIHDVQLHSREWDCLGAPEWEAYRLQDLWLQEHGVILPFDWPAIRRLSECPSGEP